MYNLSNNEYFTRAMSVVIVVAIVFLIIGVYLGGSYVSHNGQVTTVYKTVSPKLCTYTTMPSIIYNGKLLNDELETLDFIDNISYIILSVNRVADLAIAVSGLIDDQVLLESYVSPSQNALEVMKGRRVYLTDQIISILDSTLKRVSELKPIHNVSPTDIKLLQEKISELHQLAVQLRTIGYKDHLTNNDDGQALAIVRNMLNIRDDISNLTDKLINNV